MQIACSSQSFDRMILDGSMSLRDFFQYCSSLSFIRGVELEDKHILHPHDDEYLRHIRELVSTYRLPIVNLAFDNNFGYSSEDKLNAEAQRVKEWVETAKRLDIPNFRLFAGWPDKDKGSQWATMVDHLGRSAEIVASAGLQTVVENHNHGGFLSSSDDTVRLFRDMPPGAIHLLLDTGNYTDGLDGALKTAKWAGHVHAKVKETDPSGKPADINYPPIVTQLATEKYRGWLSVEYEGDADPFDVVRTFGSYLHQHIKLSAT
jgi:sugar phosphate isomerase/epimerase